MANIKFIKKWHLLLVWPALIASIIYVVSAFTHPLMAWTGPQAKVMFPPSLSLEPNQLSTISDIISKNNIASAKMIKLVPHEEDVLLQVTENALSPRLYYSLANQNQLSHHDETQAIWLAQHYLKENHPIKDIEIKTAFDESYPSVNRLLPVYKINFDTQDNLSVYIHTDTQALAGIENDWKKNLRFVFQTFHSFTWLNDYEYLRLGIISLLIICLTAMSITGLLFLLKLKRKKTIPDLRRRWHRRISWFVVTPLLLFCISGIYHLWQSSLMDAPGGMTLTQDVDLNGWPITENIQIDDNLKINQVSLLQLSLDGSENTQNLYRVSVSPIQKLGDQASDINTREKRFKGQKKEQYAIYLNAKTGEILGNLDTQFIQQQAKSILQETSSTALPMDLVTHFGLGYDFRNKRLPVWRVEGSNGQQVFIDPITHILVDRNTFTSRLEGYSFSFLHKWNMLAPVIGRFNRDMIILFTLGLTFLLTILGLALYLKPENTVRANANNNDQIIEKKAA